MKQIIEDCKRVEIEDDGNRAFKTINIIRNDGTFVKIDISYARLKSEWICTLNSSFPQYEPSEYRCSICKGVGSKFDKFCKHCGADMRKDLEDKDETDIYSINNMSVSDIIHWCATHPDPDIKKQFEEELAKYNKLKENVDDRTETDPHH